MNNKKSFWTWDTREFIRMMICMLIASGIADLIIYYGEFYKVPHYTFLVKIPINLLFGIVLYIKSFEVVK